MRAFVITGPGRAEVREVDPPRASAGEVVIDVERAGVCGTDVEFFSGEMAYLHSGEAAYPLRIGHEWCGRVTALGDGVDQAWLGRRVTGDTMLGCGRCGRCTAGRQHLCAERHEVGIRNGWPGALAEQLLMPARALHQLPDTIDPTRGALVEPGGNAWRTVRATALSAGERLLIVGAGAIGLLAAQMAEADGVEVHLLGRSARSLAFARSLGLATVWTAETLPVLPFGAVIDASNSVEVPARAVDLVEPGGRVVLIGLAGQPSLIDSRRVALNDVTVVGILSGSPGLAGAMALYGSGRVDPTPLVAAVVSLGEVADVLAGRRAEGWGAAPKIHVDPSR